MQLPRNDPRSVKLAILVHRILARHEGPFCVRREAIRKTLRMLVASAAIFAALAAPPALAGTGTLTGAAGGAVAGAVGGGPVGAAVGGIVGAVVGTAVEPPPVEVVSYVEDRPLPPPVMLEGDVVVGATLPPSVALYPVPPSVHGDSDGPVYAYAVVNGHTVIVDPQTYVVVDIVD
jgi:hypothetical protein